MDAEGCILVLMVAGVPASVALFAWAALQSSSCYTSFRPVWVVLLEGREEEDDGRDGRDDWGGWWPPSEPPLPPDGAIQSPSGECRRGLKRDRMLRRATHKPRNTARVAPRYQLES